jgi:hypothetical protein
MDAFDIAAEHRQLDALLGRFLAAAEKAEIAQARASIAEFDDALRRHTAREEEGLFAPPPAKKLIAPAEEIAETAEARLSRELRLEHVQIRELSGMMRRLLEESGDVDGARRLFPNLARRWDAHTEKEERELT